MQVYYLEFLVVALGLVMLMIDAFVKLEDKRSLARFGILGLSVIFLLLFNIQPPADTDNVVWKFYAAPDGLSLFFKGVALLTTILSLVMAIDFAPIVLSRIAPPDQGAHPQAGLGEFYTLPVFVCAGLMWMASANNLVSIFVSIEVVSITFIILAGYMRRNVGSLEAGVKYLILGALSAGFLVYGFSWLYGITGSMELGPITEALAKPEINSTAAMFAFSLILVSLAFKLGAAPFHIWIPDVYQGAATPITAFLSVGSKAGAAIVTLRLVYPYLISPTLSSKTLAILGVIAVLTLLLGNLGALAQKNLKRLMGYSSIGHSGFLVMALASTSYPGAVNALSPAAVFAYYIGAYLLMTLLVFLVLSVLNAAGTGETIDSVRGLSKRSPFLAGVLLIGLASLAGVPLTAGFVGKFLVFKIALDAGQWTLIAAGLIGAAAGFYFYLKIAASMYLQTPSTSDGESIPVNLLTKVSLVILAILILLTGIVPNMIVRLFS